MANSRNSVGGIIFVVLAISAAFAAWTQARGLEKEFLKHCRAQYPGEVCERTVEMSHGPCIRKATPPDTRTWSEKEWDREHRVHYDPGPPDPGKYRSCMSEDAKSRARYWGR